MSDRKNEYHQTDVAQGDGVRDDLVVLNTVLSPVANKNLDRLVDYLGSDREEVLRRAIRHYLVKIRAQGGEL